MELNQNLVHEGVEEEYLDEGLRLWKVVLKEEDEEEEE